MWDCEWGVVGFRPGGEEELQWSCSSGIDSNDIGVFQKESVIER